MTEFTEGNLQITFRGAVTARKFDDQRVHGLSCMKAVDFIVEEENRLLFIEFKEPLHPKSKPQQKEEWFKNLCDGEIDNDLKYKYRDTYLYEWACNKKIEKPIYYMVLLDIDSLDAPALLNRTDALKRALPLNGPPSGAWKRPIVAGCVVFNIDAWNRHFSNYQVTRVV